MGRKRLTGIGVRPIYEEENDPNPWPAIIVALIVVALIASACGG